MFEKLTKLSRGGQRQEGTRTLVKGGDGAEGGNWERKVWAATLKRVEEAKMGVGDLLVWGGRCEGVSGKKELMKRGVDCGVALGRRKDPGFWRDRGQGQGWWRMLLWGHS